MKKSEILAIPYCRHSNKEWYAARKTAKLSDQNAEIIDIFYQGQPVVRYVIGATQYLTYICTEKRWSTAKIINLWGGYYGNFYSYMNKSGYNQKLTVSKSISSSYGSDWITKIGRKQDNIENERKEKSRQLRDFESRKTAGMMPTMTDSFKQFVKKDWGQGIMWTLHQNGRTFLTCSKCGNRDVVQGTVKNTKKLKCAYCGENGLNTPEKKYKEIIEESAYYNDVRPYEKGIAIIAVEVTRTQQIGQPIRYEFEEQAAEIFLPGRKTPDEYWIQGDRWKKGVNREQVYGGYDTRKAFPTGPVPPYTAKVLRKSMLKYTGWEKYGYELYKYLREWQKNPGIELLIKQGLTKLVTHNLNSGLNRISVDLTAHSLTDALGIRADRKKMLKEAEGDPLLIRTLRFEREIGRMKDETLDELRHMGVYEFNEVKEISQWVSPDKALKYIKTQKVDFQTYADFLKMRSELGYDMTDRLFPRDLRAAHDNLTEEKDAESRQRTAEKYEKEYPGVKKSYRRLNKIYKYEDEGYIIRPAKNCTEIVEEGAKLHHCVGSSSTYVYRHDKGESFILFMRKKEDPNTPFATIEIGKDNEIRQWYEAYDEKKDKEKIQPILDKYVKHLKEVV